MAPLADGLCGAAKPLRVTALPDGVPLSPAATLTCVAAEALGRWSTEVRVIAERTLSSVPKTIQIGGSYECRGQNHDPSAKLSEHAYANGVDVMGFTFEGRAPVTVGAARRARPRRRSKPPSGPGPAASSAPCSVPARTRRMPTTSTSTSASAMPATACASDGEKSGTGGGVRRF